MRKPTIAVVLTCLFLASLVGVAGTSDESPHTNPKPTCNADRTAWTMGLVFCNDQATVGYTLFAPIPSNTTYLIDHLGRYVHSWPSPGEHRPGLSAYLLPDGDLLRTANIAQTAVGNFSGGGTAGKLERISWDGELEWSWEYSSETFISHHDIEPMPNGNILMIAWEERTEAEALQAGRNPAIASDSPGGQNNVWPDHIIEIEPNGTEDANIVWKWHAWDHLIQDYDETKDNFGVVADHPERININYVGATGNQAGRADWMHCNGIDYNAVLDQIAISCRGMNEIYVIDHSTTTEEAAGHTGGNHGKGGDLLYRWGNPQVYGKGLSSDQQLFAQHDVQWIGEGHPNAGDLIVFNNGVGRAVPFSSVEILNTSYANGTYPLLSNGTFGPPVPTWSWNQGETMYAGAISGAQALPNGHLLVTYGTKGTLYEVNRSGGIVWEYINPVGAGEPYTQGDTLPDGNRAGTTLNAVFKATHYPSTYAAFTERSLTPDGYLEQWNDLCPDEVAWGWDHDGDGCIDDSDSDGVLDPHDQCSLGDDSIDADADSIPDACDGHVDSDMDGVVDEDDVCEGNDDHLDVDGDGVPDGCDALIDTDEDGVEDEKDLCDGSDDGVDLDNDDVPDGCDELIDADDDGIADATDACPNTTSQTAEEAIDENGCSPEQLDGDDDGVSDADDRCEGYDDAVDSDVDGVPDGCDGEDEVSQEEDRAASQGILNTTVALTGCVVLLAFVAILRWRRLN